MKKSDVLPDGFVYLCDVICDLICDIRYATAWNFTGRPVPGYLAPKPSLSVPAAEALALAAERFRAEGFRLLVYDAFRPVRAVKRFVEWANDPCDLGNPIFIPRLDKLALLRHGYIDAHSVHSRGSAVDLSLALPDGTPVDSGGFFDLLDPLSHFAAPGLPAAAAGNRTLLRDGMCAAGVESYPKEWWHFRLAAEPYPDRYFDFDVK